ncbi:MAG: hypothetical protein H6817_07055 [Phycisphaerales bacterium]|nr:hypothetical protein [Phycisphaerales bacterium]
MPNAFACVRCHQQIQMDEMVLLPAEGIEEEATVAEELHWLARNRHGFVRSWFSTVGMALVKPARVMQLAPVDTSTGDAWWFALVTSAFALALFLLPFLLIPMAVTGGLSVLPFGFGAACGCAGIGVVTFLVLCFWIVTAHGMLLITGKVSHSMERTVQAICFSSGANALMAIPCVGMFIGPVWWIISAMLMLSEGQRVGGFRASIAVGAFPVLLLFGAELWTTYGFNSAFTTITASVSGTRDTQYVTDAVMRYAELHNFAGPDHGLRLLEGGFLDPWDYISSDTLTALDEVPLADKTLDDVEGMTATDLKTAIDTHAKALPDNVIAHRVGDFVFTYHGVTLNNCPADLWIVICSPDPDSNADSVTMVTVGRVDGATVAYSVDAFAAQLAAQNALRAGANLPPLPDPATITHAKPAAVVSPQ